MVLGIVVGGIFERYLFISTQLYGWGWLLRPAVLAILAGVVWALYRPLSQIAVTLIEQFRAVGGGRPRFGAAPAFSLAIIVLIVAAVLSSADWPHDAKLVPLTACGMALVAAVLNLVNELFGPEEKDAPQGPHVPDLGVADDVVRWRAAIFFVWMAAFIALVFLVGFIPAIALFVFAYMRFGFGEPWMTALGFSVATTLVCYVVFHWALAVAWPPSLLGELFPDLRSATRLF